MTESVRAPAQAPRPRAWPVVVIAIAVGLALALLTAAIVVASAARDLARSGLAFSNLTPESMQTLWRETLVEPVVLGTISVLASLVLLGVALIGGGFAREGLGRRLRLRGAPVAVFLLASFGLFGFARTLEELIRLLGLGRWSMTLPISREAIGQWDGFMLPTAITAFALLPALGKEFFFRGFVQTRLSRCWGAAAGVVVAAGLAALMPLDPVQGAQMFLLGLALGAVTERAKSVWPAVCAHAFVNAIWVLETTGTLHFNLPWPWRLIAPLVLAVSAWILLLPEKAAPVSAEE